MSWRSSCGGDVATDAIGIAAVTDRAHHHEPVPIAPQGLGDEAQELIHHMCRGAQRAFAEDGRPNGDQIRADRDRYLALAATLPGHQRLRARALVLVLTDLALQGWRIQPAGGGGLSVEPPTQGVNPSLEKRRVQAQLHIERDRQLQAPPVRAFVREMERRRIHQGRLVSVFDLMRDGSELAARLRAANEETLPKAIQPYLQFIEGEERCAHTGLMLREIWRYFRHTWATPYRSTPGRSMMILVRDAAAPSHPVMGIAALSSSAAQIAARDHWIGWTRHQVLDAISAAPSDRWAAWLRRTLDHALEEVYVRDLFEDGVLVPSDLQRPTDAVLAALKAEALRSRERHRRFVEAAKHKRAAPGAVGVDDVAEGSELGVLFAELTGPVSQRSGGVGLGGHPDAGLRDLFFDEEDADEDLDEPQGDPRGEGSAHEGWEVRARTPLFRSKRAGQLAWLLRARRALDAHLGSAPTAEGLRALAATAEGRWAIRRIARKAKADRMGIALAEISICGSVAPYNHVLGGKLVAMLVTSPEVWAAYARRYGDRASLIASGMAGRPIIRGADLALLMTTSLYGSGSSQYNRLRVPCSRVGGQGGKLRYLELGATRGYGTSHFSDEAVDALTTLIARAHGGKQVNSIFGEGVNPRLRKVREGLDLLGLPSDALLVHGSARIIYGVPLARNLRDVLLGLDPHPDYVYATDRPEERTRQIVAWWRERWLSGRINREGILDRVARERVTYPCRHGARVPLPEADDPQVELPFGL